MDEHLPASCHIVKTLADPAPHHCRVMGSGDVETSVLSIFHLLLLGEILGSSKAQVGDPSCVSSVTDKPEGAITRCLCAL